MTSVIVHLIHNDSRLNDNDRLNLLFNFCDERV